MEVVPLVNAYFLAVQVLLQTKIAKTCETAIATTGNTLPDFLRWLSEIQKQLLEEDESRNSYQRGAATKDPILDLKSKAGEIGSNFTAIFHIILPTPPESVELTIGIMDSHSVSAIQQYISNARNF
jgi:hypothetical protein